MANEKKENVGVEVCAETQNGNLVVVREAIRDKKGKQMLTQDGREYFAYLVKGTLRGRAVKIDFTPKDAGGYEPLDIVFDVSPKAELIMTEEEMSDSNGKTSSYTTYTVRAVDEMGLPWTAGVKPQRNSDKDLLNMLLNVMKIALAV